MAEIQSGYAEINGSRLYLEVSGSGFPVVFLHGMSLDRRMWGAQTQAFATHFQVIRVDLRGFGNSDLPNPSIPYSHHQDINSLLRFLDIKKAHLVGLSMGARVAVDTAMAYPDFVRSLVLADPALHGFAYTSTLVQEVMAEAKEHGAQAANDMWLNSPLFQPALQNPVSAKALTKIITDYSGWHWVNENPWTPLHPPAINRLQNISVPALVVVGELDMPDFHAVADKLHVAIPNATKVVLPGVGHMSNMEAPKAFNDAVIGFLKNLSVS